jgi:tRNA threonylcarbamoyl adenosine modification protein YjeE
MKLALTCRTLPDTQRVGHLLGNQLRKNRGQNVLLLSGSVGVGKSEFARSLIRSVTRSKDLIVTSPTFVLMNSYSVHRRRDIHHLDLYRLGSKKDLEVLNLESLYDRGDDLIVEWPQLLLPLDWPHLQIQIELGAQDPDHRVITLESSSGEAAEKLIQQLDSAIKSS